MALSKEVVSMGLSDDQRDDALKALRGVEEALEYLVKGVKGLEESATLRSRIEELETYLKRAKMALDLM
ncbi:MAG: hypothetical protein OEN01_16370 [Candidatus Krumholzibacteria bacterium]|nr:hypothetical protein [Candidatus Krumholzibacteria bacterium]